MDNKKKEVKDEHELIRLNKFLSDAGVCSRREGDRLIEAGKVCLLYTSNDVSVEVKKGALLIIYDR